MLDKPKFISVWEPKFCGDKLSPIPGYSPWVTGAFFCIALGFFVSLGGNVFIYYYRTKPVIQVSQPVFLHCFCLGWAILNFSGIFRVFNSYAPFYNQICMVEVWLIHLSLTFIIAILTTKEWRTWRVRQFTAKMKRYTVTENVLFLYVGLSLLVGTIILIVWTLVTPSTINPCATYQCDSFGLLGFWLFVSFQCLQVSILIIIAFKDWNLGQVGGDGPGIIVTATTLFVLVILFFVSRVYHGKNDMDVALDTNAVEAFITYVVCLVSTILSLVFVVFHKCRYFNLNTNEVMSMFIRKKSENHSNLYQHRNTSPNPINLTNGTKRMPHISCNGCNTSNMHCERCGCGCSCDCSEVDTVSTTMISVKHEKLGKSMIVEPGSIQVMNQGEAEKNRQVVTKA